MMLGKLQKTIISMIGEGGYNKERIKYLSEVNDEIRKAKEEFLVILKRQHEQNFRDENERLKWFLKYFGECKQLKIDKDGFVKWVETPTKIT